MGLSIYRRPGCAWSRRPDGRGAVAGSFPSPPVAGPASVPVTTTSGRAAEAPRRPTAASNDSSGGAAASCSRWLREQDATSLADQQRIPRTPAPRAPRQQRRLHKAAASRSSTPDRAQRRRNSCAPAPSPAPTPALQHVTEQHQFVAHPQPRPPGRAHPRPDSPSQKRVVADPLGPALDGMLSAGQDSHHHCSTSTLVVSPGRARLRAAAGITSDSIKDKVQCLICVRGLVSPGRWRGLTPRRAAFIALDAASACASEQTPAIAVITDGAIEAGLISRIAGSARPQA